jgi:anti-sigma regulatory factor (Ser/Thr protein kinase)
MPLTPTTTDGPLGSELLLAADSSRLADAREYVERTAAGFGLDPDSRGRFVCAVNEAVTNAIRHGSPDKDGHIRLYSVIDGARLTIRVEDYGHVPTGGEKPPPDIEHGRGFAVMASFSDEVQLNARPDGTTISLSILRVGSGG